MINRCDECMHSKVCVYKQRYQEYYTTLKNDLKYSGHFSVELNCTEYKRNILTGQVKDCEVGIMPLTTNPCEGCSIYEEIKKGKTIISDACNFCSRSPKNWNVVCHHYL